MACSGKGYGTNPQSSIYLYAPFSEYITKNGVLSRSSRNCRKFNGFYPSFNPVLNLLSTTTSGAGVYTTVYVNGTNFLPWDATFVRFGKYNLPVTYYSSFNLSFTVPLKATPGTYNVQVINIYNGNFSPPVNQSYPGSINSSNSIQYQIL
jgi:hypothetical protein